MGLLNMLGLMKVEDHETAMNAKPAAQTDNSDLRRMTIGRDDWKAASLHWEAKFKAAATDLGNMTIDRDDWQKVANDQLDGIAALRNTTDELRAEIAALRTDAQLWRNARDKRSQGRGASNDAAPKAKKGVR